VVDALNIISFKNKLKQLKNLNSRNQDGFLWIPAKPHEPHLWLDHS